MNTRVDLRPAEPRDASVLAQLINMAGEGLPGWLWAQSAGPQQSALEVGAERARRDQGGFSWRNAWTLAHNNVPVAMLLGYRLDDPYELPDMTDIPGPVRPLLQLEAKAPGAWYINALATFPEWRGQGLGHRLMVLAEELARETGADQLALIVAEENREALRLYQRLGYEEAGRETLITWPGCHHRGEWLLLTRAVGYQ